MNTREFQTGVWREASRDLGFEFVAPFTLPDGDETLIYLGLLPEFGSTRGMLIIPDEEPFDVESQRRFCRAAREHGYGSSCMTMSYEPYVRENLIDVLNDWGWCGAPDRTPSWYTGSQEDSGDA